MKRGEETWKEFSFPQLIKKENQLRKKIGDNPSKAIGFVIVLSIFYLVSLFIILKLLNKLDWNWLWILSPVWISVGFIFIGMLIFAVIEKSWVRK